MESTNNVNVQKTVVTPGIGGQPTFSSGTKVSRNKKKKKKFFSDSRVLRRTPHNYYCFFFLRRYRFISLHELSAVAA